MVYLIASFLPLAVCAFWSVAITMNLWERGNVAAHRELLQWSVAAMLLYAGHFVFFNRLTSLIPLSDSIYVVCNLLVYPLYLNYITMLTQGTVGSGQRWLTVLPPLAIGIVVAAVYAMMNGNECRQRRQAALRHKHHINTDGRHGRAVVCGECLRAFHVSIFGDTVCHNGMFLQRSALFALLPRVRAAVFFCRYRSRRVRRAYGDRSTRGLFATVAKD